MRIPYFTKRQERLEREQALVSIRALAEMAIEFSAAAGISLEQAQQSIEKGLEWKPLRVGPYVKPEWDDSPLRYPFTLDRFTYEAESMPEWRANLRATMAAQGFPLPASKLTMDSSS